jgi:tetratricopeptide (TPR) repeat protein
MTIVLMLRDYIPARGVPHFIIGVLGRSEGLSSAVTAPQQQDGTPRSATVYAPQPKQRLILSLVLFAVTLGFYNPVVHCGFIYLDDVPYVMRNPVIQAGLTRATVKWAFVGIHVGFWHPLTWLSHALDCQLFGLNPAGHHYVSLLFHASNAGLLFLLLMEATGTAWPSLLISALFALHPENVESVAWAAERKNVLSMFFFLLGLWAYGRYARNGGWRRYTAVVACFALGLMSKPQVITFPCVLLLWDYWPLERMFTRNRPQTVGGSSTKSLGYLLWEKIPLFVLAAGEAVLTVWSQRVGSALRTLGEYSLSQRLSNAAISYVRYLAHTFWPARLAPEYPHPGSWPGWEVVGSLALLLAITIFVWFKRDRRYLLMGWLWFLGTLIPMIGIVQVGEQAMADRFAYIPMIGLFIALVWAATDWVIAHRITPKWTATPAVALVLITGVLTYRQLGHWHDGQTVWRYTISVTERNYLAYDNLAMVLGAEGKPDEAITAFRVSEELHRYPLDQVLTLGVYEQRHGHVREAIGTYQKVVNQTDDLNLRATAWTQLGAAYAQLKDHDQSKRSYENALQLNPREAGALMGSGMLAECRGDPKQAAAYLARAVNVEPNAVNFLLLAHVLRRDGRAQEAEGAEQQARKISPDLSPAEKSASQTEIFLECASPASLSSRAQGGNQSRNKNVR